MINVYFLWHLLKNEDNEKGHVRKMMEYVADAVCSYQRSPAFALSVDKTSKVPNF